MHSKLSFKENLYEKWFYQIKTNTSRNHVNKTNKKKKSWKKKKQNNLLGYEKAIIDYANIIGCFDIKFSKFGNQPEVVPWASME